MQIKLPSLDKDVLFRELRAGYAPEVAKAIIDDCYLGYIDFEELSELLDEFSAGRNEAGDKESVTANFRALLAECLACRRAEIVNQAVDYLEASHPLPLRKREVEKERRKEPITPILLAWHEPAAGWPVAGL